MADDLLLLRGTDYLLLRGTDRLILRVEVTGPAIDFDIQRNLEYRTQVAANQQYRDKVSADLEIL